MRHALIVAAIGIAGLSLAGCTCNPVDDPKGTYNGTWWVGEDEQSGCNLRIDINESAESGVSADLTGSGALVFSCINDNLPQLFQQFNLTIPDQTQQLAGSLTVGGLIDLGVPEDFQCPENEADPCVRVTLNGVAEDTDNDGQVDVISGRWNLTIRVNGQDVSSPIPIGNFRVTRA